MTNLESTSEQMDTSVRVAVRVRPQNAKERLQMNQICTSVTLNEPQIFMGKDKGFTFDYVFNMASRQDDIFQALSKSLIDGCLEGYNATILAYGQTGSGKTFTMGTGFDVSLDNSDVGIIPRAVHYLFTKIDMMRTDFKTRALPIPDFKIVAQFLELYNEELIDLLDTPDNKNMKSHIKIHENTGGSIYLTGVSTRLVMNVEETLKCLKDGSLCRSTASTNMNSQSSRSHAIFTLHIKQQRLILQDDNMESSTHSGGSNGTTSDFETLTAKFHFVDLAGSERLKRTGATGDRAKEGISINCGLLALGNVISTLGDRSKRGQHVPYRNSKLTRLLQDSLGGNSQTIMIACISPSDCDFLETLNTLNYANRARNIKNRLCINQDKTSKQLSAMRAQIEALQNELSEYKQSKLKGKRTAENEDGFSDMHSENTMLQGENQNLRIRIKALSNTIDTLKARNAQILAEKDGFMWNLKKSESNLNEINLIDLESEEILKIIDRYTREVEDLRAKLAESEAMVIVLQRSNSAFNNMDMSRQSHISMTGEFPDIDYVFEMISEESYIISPGRKSGHKKNQRQKQNHPSGEADTELGSLDMTSFEYASGGGGGGADIDKDSLNGDEGEETVVLGNSGPEEEEVAGEENEENEEEEEEDDDESDTENQDAENYLHHSLATLSSEIDVKRRLIEELQAKQRQLRKIRSHYEQQLDLLQTRIKETEHERDQVLANLGEVEVTNEERVRKVRVEYEKKLSNLKAELNQLQTAKREHTLMLKNAQRKDQELRQLQKDLGDLKSLKVQMSKKLREEAKRSREIESVRNREIVQLRKEKRIKDHQIRNLEQDKLRRDTVLKRKQEEVESLRKRSQVVVGGAPRQAMSTPVGVGRGRVTMTTAGRRPTGIRSIQQSHTGVTPAASQPHARRHSVLAKLTKSKLDCLESALCKTVSRRHTINSYEHDMNTRVRERDKLSRKLMRLEARRQQLQLEGKLVEETVYAIKNVRAQIDSVQEEIAECQSSILEMEEAKSTEAAVPGTVISSCSLDEAQYLLDSVYQLAIGRGLLAQSLEAREEALRLELQTRTQEREQALDMLRIALQHSTVPFDVDGLFGGDVTVAAPACIEDQGGGGTSSDEEDEDEDDIAVGNLSLDHPQNVGATTRNFMFNPENGPQNDNRRQVSKRKPATPEELLGVQRPPSSSSLSSEAKAGMALNLDNNNNSTFAFNFKRTTSTTLPGGGGGAIAQTPTETSSGLVPPVLRAASVGGDHALQQSNTPAKPGSGKAPAGAAVLRSPNRKQLTWKHPGGSMTTSLIVAKGGSIGEEAANVCEEIDEEMRKSMSIVETPPMSPSNFRRAGSQRTQNEENVFKRLTNSRPSPNPKKGSIFAVPRKMSTGSGGVPLMCTYVAEGHTKSVLDVDVSENIMITGSKDRTAKIWDLNNLVETGSLADHQNSVTRVRYCPEQQAAFTVCAYYIKMWDMRVGGPSRCVRTLWSSGLSQDGGPELGCGASNQQQQQTGNRQAVCPPPGENFIMDLALAQHGNTMFLATANSVKLWDMRQRFCAVGKLHGNHQAPVMVLVAGDRGRNCTTLVTGSKDHYIKVFDVTPGSLGLLTPSQELQPPHYDGVESLALDVGANGGGGLLFSGSRDACIKKWDMESGACVASLSQAHRDWVQALCLVQPSSTDHDINQLLLVSGCRSGVLKLWTADSCGFLGDVQAHEAGISALRATPDGNIFSASNDCKIKVWRRSSSSESS